MMLATLGIAVQDSMRLPAPLRKHAGAGNAEAVQNLHESPRQRHVRHLHKGRLVVMVLVRMCGFSSEERALSNSPEGAPIPHIAVQ